MKKPAKNKAIPKILLIGAGRFGKRHLATLKKLEARGLITLYGAIVKTADSKAEIEKEYSIPVWTKLTTDLLKEVDAVDIVTPPSTHAQLALRCLPFTDVFVEKPLALSIADTKLVAKAAKKYGRKVMVGHIFRFEPVIEELKDILSSYEGLPLTIKGEFINPSFNDIGMPITFEMPHHFDMVSYVLPQARPNIVTSSRRQRVATVDVKYGNNIHAEFKIGWRGDMRSRFIDFHFPDTKILCDLLEQKIRIIDLKKSRVRTVLCRSKEDALTKELTRFVELLKGRGVEFPGLREGAELVVAASKAAAYAPQAKKRKIAIIGGGIFGTNCAIELGKSCDVTVFERNEDIMDEASFVNQYRHHWGYHYPRSNDTVRDIRNAIGDFEALYNKAIIRDFPTYYCIAKKGSKVSAQAYKEFCDKHGLAYTIEYPDVDHLDRSKVSLSLKTLEPIYDYKHLKLMTKKLLAKSKNINLRLGAAVIGGRIDKNGKKILTIVENGKKREEVFDQVINTTYARYNQFTSWFKFPTKPVRIDLVEALIVKLPLPKLSFAIMDGPFTNLVPTPDKNLFTLVHIKESIIERYVPANGLPHRNKPTEDRAATILKKSAKWLPILKEAEVVEKRHVFRAVNAYREHDDARPSDIAYHGFGCWSILGGKIVNSVTVAKQIADHIKNS